MTQWFRRLAEVPGIEYECRANIDRSLLPEYDAIPEIGTYKSFLNGKIDDYLHNYINNRINISWKTTEDSTSASPALRWQRLEPQLRLDETIPQAVLRRLIETLELPGILSDYHYALQSCHELLWQHRRKELWIIAEIERLCLLDIQLVEVQNSISVEREIDFSFGWKRLIQLYEREGNIHEAFAIAQRGDIFYQDRTKYERKTLSASLQPRLTQFEAEDDA